MKQPFNKVVSCPTCGCDSHYIPENPYRPFCSLACKTGDLGAWAQESFKVPMDTPTDPGDGSETSH